MENELAALQSNFRFGEARINCFLQNFPSCESLINFLRQTIGREQAVSELAGLTTLRGKALGPVCAAALYECVKRVFIDNGASVASRSSRKQRSPRTMQNLAPSSSLSGHAGHARQQDVARLPVAQAVPGVYDDDSDEDSDHGLQQGLLDSYTNESSAGRDDGFDPGDIARATELSLAESSQSRDRKRRSGTLPRVDASVVRRARIEGRYEDLTYL